MNTEHGAGVLNQELTESRETARNVDIREGMKTNNKVGTWAVYRLSYFGRELEYQGSYAACSRIAELMADHDRDAEIEKVSDEEPEADGFVLRLAAALSEDGAP
jgi:hypothetical protein